MEKRGNITLALCELDFTSDSCRNAYRAGFCTRMASFSDCPLEFAAEVIGTLDNMIDSDLKASLMLPDLPLASSIMSWIHFRYIQFSSRRHEIISFGSLLDSNPSISDSVHKFVREIRFQDYDDDDVPRILWRMRTAIPYPDLFEILYCTSPSCPPSHLWTSPTSESS